MIRIPSFSWAACDLVLALCCSSCTFGSTSFSESAATSKNPSPADSAFYEYRGTAESRVRLGDRQQASSVLIDVFGETAAAPITVTWILEYPNYMGGPCDPMIELTSPSDRTQDGCPTSSDSQAPGIPGGSSIRASYLIQACEILAGDDAAIEYAAKQAEGGTAWSGAAPDATRIAAAWDLFHPGSTPSETIQSALSEVVSAVDEQADVAESARPLEKWRFLLLTLCLDPSWGIL